MQSVRAACVRPAPSMRVCARSHFGRASIAKAVVHILQQHSKSNASSVRWISLPDSFAETLGLQNR